MNAQTQTYLFPYPPSVNNYWRSRGNTRFISKQGMAFRKNALAVIAEQGNPQLGGARVRVVIHVHKPDKRKRDLDNLLKPVLDALEHGKVVDDDSQIDDLRIRSAGVRSDGGCVVVEVSRVVDDG
jgi:crossover junction endodeoxyribonuclease RusA